jgi:hypothetical protein
VYRVEIHRDGTVLYQGDMAVRVHGPAQSKISTVTADALFSKAACAPATAWNAEYRVPITDHDSAKVTVRLGSAPEITVEDYPPCHAEDPKTPAALCELELAIDRAADTSQWTTCRAADGTATPCSLF